MERFWCYAMGFFVALFLVICYVYVKDIVEECKEQKERKMRDIAIEEVLKEREYTKKLLTIKENCDSCSRLAKKEGEHETPEL